jgi:ThiF family
VAYRIDPSPAADHETTGGAPPAPYDHEATVVVVGCGGTGGFLAEAVGRLLLGRTARLFLVDPDRVEPHNVARQAFDGADTGRFKAQVLAERLARRFGLEVGYSVLPYDAGLHARVFGGARSRLNLLVGCVDNGAARRALTATLDDDRAGYGSPRPRQAVWWLDAVRLVPSKPAASRRGMRGRR